MQSITVSGSWPFPADMLRYADAIPASPADAELVKLLSLPFCDEEYVESAHAVNLKMQTALNDTIIRRFESFGWRVTKGEGLFAFHAGNEERDRLSLMKCRLDSALRKLTREEYDALQWYSGGRLPRNVTATFR